MTPAWMIAGAVAGVLVGPRMRATMLAWSVGPGQPPRRECPACSGQKLQAMDQVVTRHQVTHLGMPDFRPEVGRSSGAAGRP